MQSFVVPFQRMLNRKTGALLTNRIVRKLCTIKLNDVETGYFFNPSRRQARCGFTYMAFSTLGPYSETCSNLLSRKLSVIQLDWQTFLKCQCLFIIYFFYFLKLGTSRLLALSYCISTSKLISAMFIKNGNIYIHKKGHLAML
jgi:hypothetical protein